MRRLVVNCLLILALAVASCQTEVEYRTTSTLAMVKSLDSLAIKAKSSANFPYFTDYLLKFMENSVHGMPYTMNADSWLDVALVLLLKGDNDRCLEMMDGYLAANNYSEINEKSINYFKVKALAHLRKGEIFNCIQNHTGQSCIVPIIETGIHIDKRPVTGAIDVYESLVKYDSTDIQSLWFLNVCYMAVGQYPDNVPKEFLMPTEAFESDVEFPHFPNISMELGVDVNNHAGGASIEDFNNDGLLDIFTTSYSLATQSRLFINQGGSFVDKTNEFGLTGMVGGLNNTHADFNNDGLTDIFIMRGAWLSKHGLIPNSLLINKGDKFSDETVSSGLFFKGPTGSIAVSDFNLDGHLDLFVGNEYSHLIKIPSYLYVNNGDGTFTDVSVPLDMSINRYVKGANWGDVNNDGLPDLFLSVYAGKNQLYLNRGGTSIENWVFEEVSYKAGVQEPLMSFTSWFWDYDQDGLLDIFVSGYDNNKSYMIAGEVAKDMLGLQFEGATPRLYRNNGDETFTDMTKEVNLDHLLYVMGGNYGDFNNDSYPDMYLGTGEFNIWASVPNKAYLNNIGDTFHDVTTAGQFGQIQKGHGVAFGDLDNDGDQDIYHQVGGSAEGDVFQNMLFKNPGFGNNWISLKLEGTKSNRSAIGAKIEVFVSDQEGKQDVFYHYVTTGGSFGSSTLRAEIGLAKFNVVDSVNIHWPNVERTISVFKNIGINQHYIIKEGVDHMVKLNMEPTPFQEKNTKHEHH